MTQPITKAARIEALVKAFDAGDYEYSMGIAEIAVAVDPLAPFCDWLLDETHGAARQKALRKVIAGEAGIIDIRQKQPRIWDWDTEARSFKTCNFVQQYKGYMRLDGEFARLDPPTEGE